MPAVSVNVAETLPASLLNLTEQDEDDDTIKEQRRKKREYLEAERRNYNLWQMFVPKVDHEVLMCPPPESQRRPSVPWDESQESLQLAKTEDIGAGLMTQGGLLAETPQISLEAIATEHGERGRSSQSEEEEEEEVEGPQQASNAARGEGVAEKRPLGRREKVRFVFPDKLPRQTK
ncbi:MAG: hypothetical protein BJ554DRAFT_585 [Olpidium bornovanus]|uniref:Uncharacterized protein n=1 Tax=Olpidium bornovanus TaxID=278681 RepID=A0A8H7ZT84_9FUNG|nr:MAG: hypothetical protein BJ554DRAFT_585 [Olpidium bornovanus]